MTVGNQVEKREFAGFWIRTAAFAVDSVVLILISIVAALLFVSLRLNFNVEVVSGFVGFVINAGYYIFMTYKYGATVGKKVFGIKVESYAGERMDIGTVIVREVAGKFISSMLFGLGYIWIVFDKKKQGLHDKLGSTVVIKEGKEVANWKIFSTAITFLILAGSLFVWVLTGVLDEDFQDEINQGQVIELVSKTLNAAKLCVSEGNEVIGPISQLGGGDVCGEAIGTSWPKLGAGYSYGEVNNQKVLIVKAGENIIECEYENSECLFID